MVPTRATVGSGQIQLEQTKAESEPPKPRSPLKLDESVADLPPAIDPRPSLIKASEPTDLPRTSILQTAPGDTGPDAATLQKIVQDEVEAGHKPKPKPKALVATPPVAAPRVELPPATAAAPKTESKPQPEPTPKPAKPEAPATPAPVVRTPEQIWREGVDQLLAVARKKAGEPSARDSGLWNFRARLVAWLAEPAIDPDFSSNDQLASWRSFLKALRLIAAASDTSGAVPKASRSAEIREAVRALEAHAPLEMTDLALSRKVSGFGSYETLDPPARKVGQPVILYAELEGLTFEPVPGGFRSRLASRVEIVTDLTSPPVWSLALGTAEDHCKRKRRDFYINNRFTIPDTLKPGNYLIRSLQTDLISGKTVSKEVAIQIQP